MEDGPPYKSMKLEVLDHKSFDDDMMNRLVYKIFLANDSLIETCKSNCELLY